MKIAIINGPNLNLIGKRETNIYGNKDLLDYLQTLRGKYSSIVFDYYQSNIEGELINHIHHVGFECDGIILNPGAYTHTSIAIGDAVAAVKADVVEVHIANVFAREEFRKYSHISSKCAGTITGLGLKGYELALLYLTKK